MPYSPQDTLKKLAKEIYRKRSDLQNINLHHDYARSHITHATTAAIASKGWTVMDCVTAPPIQP